MKQLSWPVLLAACSLLGGTAPGVRADEMSRKPNIDGWTDAQIRAAFPEFYELQGNRRIRPAAIPDIFGPGAVLTVGNLFMKVTNFGIIGNPFTNVSSDPSAQWPGASSVEYMNYILLSVGAVNPLASDPTAVRRVSRFPEWRPATLAPEDRMYPAYDGILNGTRFVNDDGDVDPLTGDARIDEDFLDGHDNDGDNRIDEDFAALGQKTFSCVMTDYSVEAINAVLNEKHVPLGLDCQQLGWAYSIPGFQNFNVIEYTLINRSGHALDSLVVGWQVDLDTGPVSKANYYTDDLDLPGFPSGEFHITLPATDTRRQFPHDPGLDASAGTGPLCPVETLRVNAFSAGDDDGDDGKTLGIPSFLLINHTVDPLGISGPPRVGFRAFRSFTFGTPYSQGGNPTIDQQRFELMTSNENIDPETGFITSEPNDQKGDFGMWCSIGPWRNVPDGGVIQATIAFAVDKGTYVKSLQYRTDYPAYVSGAMTQDALIAKYPSLATALSAQQAYEGVWEFRPAFPQTTFHGREAALRAKRGEPAFFASDCRDEAAGTSRLVNDLGYTWFDFDCSYCTGVWDYSTRQGLFHKTWNAEAPPPNPNVNVSVKYNYTDNPARPVAPAGDAEVTLAWDNLSEVTPDPKSSWLDCRGYKIWKVAGWTRPVGSPGPGDDDWSLVGEFRLFEYRRPNRSLIPANYDTTVGVSTCPQLYVPNWRDSTTGNVGPAVVPICLQAGDLWNRQTGQIIHPSNLGGCVKSGDTCEVATGGLLGTAGTTTKVKYNIGRYVYVDREVKNGFLYFYAVTAFDSTGSGTTVAELEGRRSAVEAEGVVPQVSALKGKHVWVVPNPYRGFTRLRDRPSAWDLTPNASDPTGTHVDFLGMPPGRWKLKIFTVSGDLVAEIHSDDAVNESVRTPVTDDAGTTRPGYNRQQDTPNDGQASWNLISRNGQDVVSGIYLFTVESGEGIQRGRFVIIR